jgi:hypothetical protein
MKNYSATPAEQTAIDEAKKDMQYRADETYGITDFVTGTTYSKGVWVRVTRVDGVTETTKFVGVMWSVSWDIKNNTMGQIQAIGIDGLLSMCSFIGSVHETTNTGTPYQFDSIKGIFNEKEQGNQSTNTVNVGGDNIYIFNYGNIDNKFSPRYWFPSHVFKYVLHRLKRQTHTGGKKLYHWWQDINGGQLTYQGPNPFSGENKVSDYDIYQRSVWGVLVDLVETNGLFTLTVTYTGDEPKIEVIGL